MRRNVPHIFESLEEHDNYATPVDYVDQHGRRPIALQDM
jgi:hypothetical protein